MKKHPNNVPEGSERAAISVSEMAAMCQLSRSRFHALVREGIFPKPVQPGEGKRPYYTQELIRQCLDIRKTGIGQNGEIVLFNRRAAKKPDRKHPATTPSNVEHPELVESLKALGLTVTADVVAEALEVVFPGGTGNVDQGEIVRKVFLHLQGRRT